MKLTIEITMDNDAFRHPVELDRILLGVGAKVFNQLQRSVDVVCDTPEIDDKLLDVNGNTVGSVKLEGVLRCYECSEVSQDLVECSFCETNLCEACASPGNHESCKENRKAGDNCPECNSDLYEHASGDLRCKGCDWSDEVE